MDIIVYIIAGAILLLGFIFLFILANKRSYRTKGIESDKEEVEEDTEIEDEHPIKHYERKRDKLSGVKKRKQKESEDSFIFDRTLDTGIGFMPLLFGIVTIGVVLLVGSTVMSNMTQILNTTTSSYQSNDVVNVLDSSISDTVKTMTSFMVIGFVVSIGFIVLRVFISD